ncbi:MAG: GDP-mannose 4,6-dehydratase [Candidatus Hodarchaeota archaeon]
MLRGKSIIITGAAGFIGSHLTEILLKSNNFLTLIDNFNPYYPGKKERLAEITSGYEISKDYELLQGDLLDNSIYTQIDKHIDIIFHLAAQAGVRYSIEHPIEVSRNNIISTANVFEFASKLDNVSKIVYASSSSVYGNPLYTPCDELHPTNPISPYAMSKYIGEIYANYYYRECGLPITSLRFYTVYGPRGRPDMAVYKFFNLMFQDKEITIYGDGEQLRDFTYISDIINGLILAGKEKKQSKGEIFNLGYANPISINELVDRMYKIANKTKKIRYIQKQKGDVNITHSDISKAKNVLRFRPKVDINEGLILQYQWQLDFYNKLMKG